MYIPRKKILIEKYSEDIKHEEIFVSNIKDYYEFKIPDEINPQSLLDKVLSKKVKTINIVVGESGKLNKLSTFYICKKQQCILFEINTIHSIIFINESIFPVFDSDENKIKIANYILRNYKMLFKRYFKLDVSKYSLGVGHNTDSDGRWGLVMKMQPGYKPLFLKGGENQKSRKSAIITLNRKSNEK